MDGVKDHNFENAPNLGEALERAAQDVDGRYIEIDVAKYQAELDDLGLSEAQKEELLSAVLSMVMAYTELGFTLREAPGPCGQVEKDLDAGATMDSDVVDSNNTENSDDFTPEPERK